MRAILGPGEQNPNGLDAPTVQEDIDHHAAASTNSLLSPAAQDEKSGLRQAVPSDPVAPPVHGLRLSVLSGEDGTHLATAKVVVSHNGSEAEGSYGVSGASGDGPGLGSVIVIPQTAFLHDQEQTLTITAPGHCKQTVEWLAGMTEETVILDVAAMLTVHVRDEAGTPLRGVPIDLLPESRFSDPQSGEGAAATKGERALAKQSDASGNATWENLPAGRAYRLMAKDGSVISYDPPTVYRDRRREDGKLQVFSGDMESSASGSIELQPGEHRTATCVIARRGAITGTLLDVALEPAFLPVVKVMHLSSPEVNAARGYRSTELEATAYANSEGRFRIEGIRPGRKVLRASWREVGNHFYFAKQEFVMAVGEVQDLGKIGRLPGGSLQVTAVPVGSDGQVVSLETIGQEKLQLPCPLRIRSRDKNKSSATSLRQVLPIRLGETIQMHGLREGECQLVLSAPRDLGPDASWVMPDAMIVEVPSTAHLELPVVIPNLIELELSAHYPAGMQAAACIAQVVPLAGNKAVQTVQLQPIDSGSSFGSLRVNRGPYQVLVRSSSIGTDELNGDLMPVGAATIDVGPSAQAFDVQLEQGASVRGQLGTRARSSLTAGRLALGIKLPSSLRPVRWTHPQVPIDAEGRFTVSGLIPMADYVTDDGRTFTTGATGSTQLIEFMTPH